MTCLTCPVAQSESAFLLFELLLMLVELLVILLQPLILDMDMFDTNFQETVDMIRIHCLKDWIGFDTGQLKMQLRNTRVQSKKLWGLTVLRTQGFSRSNAFCTGWYFKLGWPWPSLTCCCSCSCCSWSCWSFQLDGIWRQYDCISIARNSSNLFRLHSHSRKVCKQCVTETALHLGKLVILLGDSFFQHLHLLLLVAGSSSSESEVRSHLKQVFSSGLDDVLRVKMYQNVMWYIWVIWVIFVCCHMLPSCFSCEVFSACRTCASNRRCCAAISSPWPCTTLVRLWQFGEKWRTYGLVAS